MSSTHPTSATLTICACLLLSSCQSTVPVAGSSAGSSRLAAQTADYERTIAEGVYTGALIGGIGAGIVTAASGGDSREIARNAGLGTLIGAAVGGVGGYGVAESKKTYAAREDRLQAVIRRAQISNRKLSQLVATAEDLVRERRAQIASLDSASRERRRDLSAAIDKDRRNLSEAIDAARKDIAQLRSLKGRYGSSSALDAEIGSANAKRAELTRKRATLTDIREKL